MHAVRRKRLIRAGSYANLRVAWLLLARHGVTSGAEAFVEAFPLLLDKSLPERHWSRDLLWSDAARRAFVEPDRLALP
jgi:hypothetical protein